tara:strand:- start:587 stop:868 length:282 start_codon:yes stop_codon:yes gene_type:complete
MSETIVERFVDNEQSEIQTFRDGSKHLRVSDAEGKFCRFDRMLDGVIGFGKYKGTPIKELDSGYCKWLIEQEWCKPELVRTIKYEKEETLKLI